MEKDITYYKDLILSEQVQSLIDPYRDIFVLISIVFFIIGLVLLYQEKFFFAEIKRRVFDFFSDAKKFNKSKKFVHSWERVERLFKRGDYGEMIIAIDKLMLEILQSFAYVGDNTSFIIDMYNITDSAFPNVENVKRVYEISKSIKEENNYELGREEMVKIFNLSKETLIKINILHNEQQN